MEECETLGEYIDEFIPEKFELVTGSSIEVIVWIFYNLRQPTLDPISETFPLMGVRNLIEVEKKTELSRLITGLNNRSLKKHNLCCWKLPDMVQKVAGPWSEIDIRILGDYKFCD